MRYGRPNTGDGPEVSGVLKSASNGCRGDGIAAALGDGEGALVSGGGSIVECDVGGLEGTAGSGSSGMSSSVRVSMVISFVSALAVRML